MPACGRFLLSVLWFGFVVSTRANVIDFETGSFLLSLGQTGSLEGFDFTAGGQASSVLLAPVIAGNCIPSCVSNGTKTLGAFNGADAIIDPILSSYIFDLDSFDVAGTATAGSTRNATSIKVIGNLFGGGQVNQIFPVSPSAFQTLTLNSSFTGLSSVEFDGLTPVGFNSPEFQLDNITYTQSSPSTPEPASIAVLATVLLATALVTIRRKLSKRLPEVNPL